jgi:N-acetylglucosaminyldiphosphoundecaprenol N-acetyl-beta-D-mannosaminyltransferase
MNDWMRLNTPLALERPAAHNTHQVNAADPRSLRALDLGLAIAAGMMLVLMLPLLLWATLTGERHDTRLIGAHHRGFTLYRWRFPEGFSGRWLTRLGARHWPTLINILRGDMAWIGPRPRHIGEHAGPAAHLRPGLTGLHQLRQATSVDFMTEDASDAAYLTNRSLAHDARLLLLCAWHHGRHPRAKSHTTPLDKVRILDVQVDNLLMDDAVHRVLNLIDAGHHARVSFVNPACANIAAVDVTYRRDLAASTLVLPDGIGMKIAGDWLGTPIRQNVNGTDFFPRLCNAMNERRQRLYLVGARPQVVARVAEVVRERWPLIDVVGAQHGYFVADQEASLVQDIKESGAHVVLVAMGVPTQERFIARNGAAMGHCVAIGVGGLFDFVAGRVSRAPQWMRDAGLEWVWRLLQEPGRMWRRYLLGNFSFLARVALQRRGWRSPQTQAPADVSHTPAMGPVAAGGSALLLATHALDVDGTGPRLAASLPFGPASFAEAVVAQLATRSVRNIHVLTAADGPSTQTLRDQLGDGRRWGVRVHWHQSARANQPYQPLRAVADTLPPAHALLMIQAHTWLNASDIERLAHDPKIAVCASDTGGIRWQGWATVRPDDLRAISCASIAQALETCLLDQVSERKVVMAKDCASADDRDSWLHAQTSVPAACLLALQTDVWTAHPWGYASAHAHVSPHADIEGPVWIGPGCIVRAEAHVGPHVTLSRDVVVEAHAVVSHAVGLPGAYVGRAKDLTTADVTAPAVAASVVASGAASLAANPYTHAVNDAAIVPHNPASRPSRSMGALVVALLSPIAFSWLAVRKLRGLGPAWVSEQVVLGRPKAGARLLTTTLRQSATNNGGARWLAWYGALLDVAEGRRHWVGVRARHVGQWFGLESDARAALAFAPIGVLNPVAWTNRVDCVLQAEAAADRLWLLRQRTMGQVKALWATSVVLPQRLPTGSMHDRTLPAV